MDEEVRGSQLGTKESKSRGEGRAEPGEKVVGKRN